MAEPWAFALLEGPLGEPRDALARAARAAKAFGSEVQLVSPGAVAGPRHLASAALHATRASAQGRARAQDLGLEFLCYLAGDRQIARALARAGLPAGARAAVGAALGGQPRAALEAVARELGLALSWELPSGAAEQAALERVALLDLER